MRLIERIKQMIPHPLRDLRTENYLLQERLKSAKAEASGVSVNDGVFEYELNEEFRAPKRYKNLDKMEADPHVKGHQLAYELPLVRGTWEYKPASDKPRDKEIAEFCNANLLRKSSEKFGREFWSETPWRAQRLREILGFRRDGFALFHFNVKPVGTKVVYDRIQWLEPESLADYSAWKIDEQDNLLGVERDFETPGGKFDRQVIPISELALYVWDFKGARFEGRSAWRSLYGPWLRKEHHLKQSAIGSQKFGAPAPMGSYPEGWTTPMIEAFKVFVKSQRGTAPAESWAVFPMDGDKEAKITYVGSEVEVDRLRSLIEGENLEMGHGVVRSSQNLGETAEGSRALGQSKGREEMPMVEAVVIVLAEQEMHGVGNVPGLAERLIDHNYADVKEYPELVCSKIDAEQGTRVMGQLAPLISAGVVPNTPTLRKQVTNERFGFNLPDDEFKEKPEVAAPPQRNPFPGATPRQVDEDEEKKQDRGAVAARSASFQERIARLLEPMKEGTPDSGGRFPEQTGNGGRQSRGSRGDVSSRGA